MDRLKRKMLHKVTYNSGAAHPGDPNPRRRPR